MFPNDVNGHINRRVGDHQAAGDDYNGLNAVPVVCAIVSVQSRSMGRKVRRTGYVQWTSTYMYVLESDPGAR
jgi:hypothetical protein